MNTTAEQNSISAIEDRLLRERQRDWSGNIEPRMNALLNERCISGNQFSHMKRSSETETHAALVAFLSNKIPTAFEIENVRKLAGGAGNETHSFDLIQDASKRRLILRVKAPGACCDTHIPSEFQMMKAVQSFLPIPDPLWIAEGNDDFGAPAIICSHVDGVQAPPSEHQKASGMGAVFGAELRQKLAPQFIDFAADLHSRDWCESDLSQFAKPRPNTTDAIDWRLAFWDRVWELDKIEEHPTMVLTREWLEKHKPKADRISLLHGDFRNGNFLYDPADGRITGILDWELCSLGDRHCDLGYTMLPAWGHPDEAGDFLNAGLATFEDFEQQYFSRSGLAIDPDRLHYYVIFNIWWSAIALLGTALNHAANRRTQMDVMYNLISGKGGYDICDLNRMIVGKK